MNVLVACEFSGVVREAFRAKGHNAYSLDLLPSDDCSPFHIQRDIAQGFSDPWKASGVWLWDLMIAHPPCTYLCSSGERWLKDNPARQQKRRDAVAFVEWLRDVPVKRIAIENPIGHLSRAWRKPDQIIQPWQFGHGETKATCLWLKNLPKLKPTNIVDGRENRVHRMPPSKDRWKNRSITFAGIAEAMADQWGPLCV